mmetsp:Transcript_74785/g.178496  ORF Transcript_74785/g.178496 Transcript_74785/m.178496 type:complete len:187 (+) Transcript_74785:95-655(+)
MYSEYSATWMPVMSEDMMSTKFTYENYMTGCQEEWMYYLDEIDTTDAGSHASEPEEIFYETPTTSPMGEWMHQSLLSSMPADQVYMPTDQVYSPGFTGQLATNPSGYGMAVPATEPMKVQLPPEARNFDLQLNPCIPAKKMPKFEEEFGASRGLDPKLPAKKRMPETLAEAGARIIEECDLVPAAR